MQTNKNVRTPAARQKFCRNTRVIRHGTSPRSSRRSYGDMKRSERLMLLWQTWGGLLGPFPTAGNGPRRTRRLRVTLSTEHDPVVFQYRAGKPAEILPSDDSGSRRVKPSSDGWGGRSKPCPEPAVANSLKFSRNKGTLFARQTELFRHCAVCGRLSALLAKTRADDLSDRRPLPRPPTRSLRTAALAGRLLSASLVEIDISENEFQCQLNSSFFSFILFEKTFFLIVHD